MPKEPNLVVVEVISESFASTKNPDIYSTRKKFLKIKVKKYKNKPAKKHIFTAKCLSNFDKRNKNAKAKEK